MDNVITLSKETIIQRGEDRSDDPIKRLSGEVMSLLHFDAMTYLSTRQLAVLLACYSRTEGQTVRGLAAEMDVSKPAITRALDRLTELGLVVRKDDPSDRRSLFVGRTLHGTKLVGKIRAALAQNEALAA